MKISQKDLRHSVKTKMSKFIIKLILITELSPNFMTWLGNSIESLQYCKMFFKLKEGGEFFKSK